MLQEFRKTYANVQRYSKVDFFLGIYKTKNNILYVFQERKYCFFFLIRICKTKKILLLVL